MVRWRINFSQLLNYREFTMLGRQKHTGELLVPEPSALEVELAIEKLSLGGSSPLCAPDFHYII
jgi:hypothetical protein